MCLISTSTCMSPFLSSTLQSVEKCAQSENSDLLPLSVSGSSSIPFLRKVCGVVAQQSQDFSYFNCTAASNVTGYSGQLSTECKYVKLCSLVKGLCMDFPAQPVGWKETFGFEADSDAACLLYKQWGPHSSSKVENEEERSCFCVVLFYLLTGLIIDCTTLWVTFSYLTATEQSFTKEQIKIVTHSRK